MAERNVGKITQITETGEEKLAEYRSEWESYSSKISELFSGEESEE